MTNSILSKVSESYQTSEDFTTSELIKQAENFLKQNERLFQQGIITEKSYKKDKKRTENELNELRAK